MKNTTRILLALLVTAGVGACKKPAEVKSDPPADTRTDSSAQTDSRSTTGKYTAEDLERDPCLRQRTVYFDFDRADIRAEAQATLACHGKYLRDNPSSRVTLEGHADERGTREYNLGLGERRGNAARDALTANGGSAGQLTVVSYGEERPTCTEHDESCWGRNRRAEIVYTAK